MADKSSNSAIDPLKIKKRTRCNNFTAYEKDVLVSLIENHQEIITSKKTDKNTLEEKENVWKRVTSEFNSILGYDLHNNAASQRRTARSLKYCYENLKRKVKDYQDIGAIKNETSQGNDYHNESDSCKRLAFQDDSVESRTSGSTSKFSINTVLLQPVINHKSIKFFFTFRLCESTSGNS